MKKPFPLIVILIYACTLHSIQVAAQPITPAEKTDALIKVWGFLKYYHPIISTGTQDWDSVFIAQLKMADALTDKAAYNHHLQKWIAGLGNHNQAPLQSLAYDTLNTPAPPLQWMASTTALTPQTISLLQDVLRHRHTGDGYYLGRVEGTGNADFLHERTYAETPLPDAPHRLLALARYWNMIEYFFPYKHLTDVPWTNVPIAIMPGLLAADDGIAYARALSAMTAMVNDSHAGVAPPADTTAAMPTVLGLPVNVTMIEGKAVVTGIWNDSLAAIEGLRKGDIIISINDTPVRQRIEAIRYRLAASNEAVVLREGARRLWVSTDTVLRLAWERDGIVRQSTIRRYPYIYFKPEKDTAAASRMLPGKIGYVYMAKLAPADVAKTLTPFLHTRALVLDMRCYPQWTVYPVCALLGAHSAPFAKTSFPDYSYPGAFNMSAPDSCGMPNAHPYKGRIIILVNEQTQSRAEWTTMALQTLPNVTIIGSQTAGADGNVSTITLPGNFKVYMTGLGVYYPDGRATQRAGIIPQVICAPTVAGYRAGRDEVLERALRYAGGGK